MARPVVMHDARGVGEELAETRERDGVPDTVKSAQRPEERGEKHSGELQRPKKMPSCGGL